MNLDKLLYECAPAASEEWLSALPAGKPFRPSLRYRLRMRHLLREQRRAAYTYTHPPVRRIPRRAALVCVVLLLALQLTGVISIGAIFERVINQIVQVFPYGTEFQITSRGGEDAPFVPLEFGYLPEGMEEIRREQNDFDLYLRYQDSNGHSLRIEQTYFSENSASTIILDTEDAYTETYLLGDSSVFYVEKNESRILLFSLDKTQILISGNLSKTELEKIALSTKNEK